MSHPGVCSAVFMKDSPLWWWEVSGPFVLDHPVSLIPCRLVTQPETALCCHFSLALKKPG